MEIPDYLLRSEEPFFVCSKSVLAQQVKRLSDLGLEVFYSVKTNPEKVILEELNTINTSFAVSDRDNFLSLISMSVPMERICYYERALTERKAEWLIQSGCRNFVVDTKTAFNNIIGKADDSFTILVRIKAEANNEYSGCFVPGIDWEDAKGLIDKCKNIGAKSGILHHSSSQLNDPKVWRDKFEFLSTLPELDIVDMGGGMPIDYNGEKYDKVLEEIAKGIKKIKAKRMIAEPGRFIVGPACSLITRVELIDKDKVVLNCSVYNVHIDTIIADLILPCRTLKEGKKKTYKLLGSSLCNLDVFNKGISLPELKEGDTIIFDKAGAYNFSSEFGSGSVIITYVMG
jgi:diaminopimelate decarboxylase